MEHYEEDCATWREEEDRIYWDSVSSQYDGLGWVVASILLTAITAAVFLLARDHPLWLMALVVAVISLLTSIGYMKIVSWKSSALRRNLKCIFNFARCAFMVMSIITIGTGAISVILTR